MEDSDAGFRIEHQKSNAFPEKTNQMSIDNELGIQIVLLMAKLECPTLIRRHSQRQNVGSVPSQNAIWNIFDKCLETGSTDDRERSGRPKSATAEKVKEILEILKNTPANLVRTVSAEVDVSKSVVRRVMRTVFGFKPYKMHLTQQLYEEDKDLRVEMAEQLFSIVNDPNNDGLIFSPTKQRFIHQAE